MMFYGAQTFVIDPNAVSKARTVHLTKVRLYFKTKPSRTRNKSGIESPGVTIFIAPLSGGIPVVPDISALPFSRVQYEKIRPSSDATEYTDFHFDEPVDVVANKGYAIVIKFDGDEDFELWASVAGENLIGTSAKSPGASTNFTGRWFDYASPSVPVYTNSVGNSGLVSSDTSIGQTVGSGGATGSGAAPTNPGGGTTGFEPTTWRPRNDIDLKFSVHVARFAISGNTDLSPYTNGPEPALLINESSATTHDANTATYVFTAPSLRYEYLVFDHKLSRANTFQLGEFAWQVGPYYPNNKNPKTISVVNGSVNATASNVNLTSVFAEAVGAEYVIVVSENHGGGNTLVNIREVMMVPTNTSIVVTHPFSFTNSSARYYKAPAALVDFSGKTDLEGAREDMLVLVGSNANAGVRFVNNVIESITVESGGSGYSNSDTITVEGYESVGNVIVGGYNAAAVLVTNSTGGITNVYMANLGCGFVNTSSISYTIANSTGGSTGGSGANLSFSVGMTVASELSYVPNTSGYAANCRVVNPPVSDLVLRGAARNPLGTFKNVAVELKYYRKLKDAGSSLIGDFQYHVDAVGSTPDTVVVTPSVLVEPTLKKLRVLPSWSNEQVITYEATGATQNLVPVGFTTNSSIVKVTVASNNDFTMAHPGRTEATFSKFVINDDASDENTLNGNALAKSVSRTISFANGALAEDLRVYVSAWRPVGTDVLVYAKLHNSNDPRPFKSKDWTLLEMKDSGRFSSPVNEDDKVELTYGLRQYPNVEMVLSGTVTTTNAQANVIGVGTDFATDLANGDMVRIYDPLFSDTNHQVIVVKTVTNSTHLVLSEAVSNDGIIGSGMRVDKIGYPYQAFNDVMNENVARYYSTGGTRYDSFDTVKVKVVLTSEDYGLVPKVDDLRFVGVSA